MSDHQTKLPPSWVSAPLGELVFLNPRWLDNEPTESDEVSFVPMVAVEAESGYLDATSARKWGEVRKGYTKFQEGDVLFAKITPCMENGKFALASGLIGGRAAGSTEFHVLRSVPGLEPKFVLYFLFQDSLRREARLKMKGAAGQLRVPPEFLEDLSFPLPPANEQGRIVAEIEKQFTRLESGVSALTRVQASLKRYRAAVLKAAIQGSLVPAEGATVTQSYESALPTGWRVDTIQNTVKIIDYRGRTPPFSQSGMPHLRSSNIRRGRVLWDDLAYVSPETYEAYMTRGLPEPGDILFTTEAPLGEVAPAPTDRKFSVAQRIMILRPKENDLDSRFLMYHIMSPQFQAVLYGKGTGTTVTGVSSRNFRPAQILIPPLVEQQRIVAEVERRLSFIEELEIQAETNLARAERLRQAVLKHAFEGKLAPQEPNDESARILLQRIREQHATNANGSGRAPRGRSRVKADER
jgi:type I restriction enzyme S subunit